MPHDAVPFSTKRFISGLLSPCPCLWYRTLDAVSLMLQKPAIGSDAGPLGNHSGNHGIVLTTEAISMKRRRKTYGYP